MSLYNFSFGRLKGLLIPLIALLVALLLSSLAPTVGQADGMPKDAARSAVKDTASDTPTLRGLLKDSVSAESGAVAGRAAGDGVDAQSSEKQRTPLEPLGAFELARYQYCGRDVDCIIVQNGCCDCAQGGEQAAINKNRLEAFEANFSCLNAECGEREPARVISCRDAVVSCIQHKCHHISSGEFQSSDFKVR